jgi:RHS repeat-associated protein
VELLRQFDHSHKAYARPITTTITYDKQNRVTQKTYSQSRPEVIYTLDTGTGCVKGMLCSVGTARSSTAYGYNALGQTTSVIQSMADASGNLVPYGSTLYTYDLQGNVKSLKYPSGRVVTYALSGAGRATGAATGATNYASSISYAPHGAMSGLTMGNSLQESVTFDQRMRAQTVTATLSGTQLFSMTNAYAKNGNVITQQVTTPGAPVYTQTFGYDGYGNRAVTYTSFIEDASTPTSASQYAAATNRLSAKPDGTAMPGDAYDASGNLTHHPMSGAFVYDGENRLIVATPLGGAPVSFEYDGEGRRVQKTTVAGTTTFVYGVGGELLAEYGNGTAPQTRYLTVDALGSTRMVTDENGTVTSRHDYAPFGEELGAAANPNVRTAGNGFVGQEAGVRQEFTGKERDAETGLDYFGARYFSGAQGRFTSPDKLNVTDDRLLVPSTLNKYAYAANNPLRFKDPDGRDVVALLEPPHGFMPGHFMLYANNPSNGQSAMMSFGPTDTSAGTRAIQVLGGPVGSTATFAWPKSADELRQNFTALSIQTSPEQAQDVINFINRLSTTENRYTLYQTNCTTVCRDALKAIGILPRDFASITPSGQWGALFSRYSDPSKQRFSTSTRYGEQFGSLRIDARQGTDYGNSRFGMNTFDFIMLMLKPPREACVEVSDSSTGTKSKQCE